MPYFCNTCDDVQELRLMPLNWIMMLIFGAVAGGIFGGVSFAYSPFAQTTCAGIGFFVGFIGGMGIVWKIHSDQKPFCAQCNGYDYYSIAPHEAASLRHSKKMREEQREFQSSMQQQMQGLQRK